MLMRSFWPMLVAAGIAVFATSGCFYDPDLSKISKGDTEAASDEGSDTGETDTGDAGVAADSGDTDTDAFGGIGTLCAEEGDCAEFDADYCLLDPTHPTDPGFCTVTECNVRGCPDAYQCCDCSGLGMEIMCAPEAAVAQIGVYCQCS